MFTEMEIKIILKLGEDSNKMWGYITLAKALGESPEYLEQIVRRIPIKLISGNIYLTKRGEIISKLLRESKERI